MIHDFMLPFKIVKVPNKINVIAYCSRLKRLEIPLAIDSHRQHDLENHIEPITFYYSLDNNIFLKLAKMIRQPGNHNEKLIDYLSFEWISFLIKMELIDKDIYDSGLSKIGGFLLWDIKTTMSTNEAAQRFYYNYLNLELKTPLINAEISTIINK